MGAVVVVVEGRVELVRSMDPAAINDHHDLFVGFAKDVHDLMQILAQRHQGRPLRI